MLESLCEIIIWRGTISIDDDLRDRPERVRLTASSAYLRYVHAERRWNKLMHTAIAAWTTLLTVAIEEELSVEEGMNERACRQAEFL